MFTCQKNKAQLTCFWLSTTWRWAATERQRLTPTRLQTLSRWAGAVDDHYLVNAGVIGVTTLTHYPLQTKEEGKSLQQEIAKLKAVQESTSKQVAADLALIDIDHEFSPISATGTAT